MAQQRVCRQACRQIAGQSDGRPGCCLQHPGRDKLHLAFCRQEFHLRSFSQVPELISA